MRRLRLPATLTRPMAGNKRRRRELASRILPESIAMADAPFDALRRLVLADETLRRELRACSDWPSFVAAALRLAAERGLAVSPAELEAAARDGRRAWMERHL